MPSLTDALPRLAAAVVQVARPVEEQIILVVQTDSLPLQMYNPLLGSWRRMDVGMGVFSDGDYLICAGDGCLFAFEMPHNEHAGSVLRFCPAASSWEVVVSINRPQGWDVHWDDWEDWAYGSGHIYGTFGNCVQLLNVSTGQWERLPLLSSWRKYGSVCVLDGRLLVVGGGTASVEQYLAPERRWGSIPDMPRAVSNAAAVVLDGKLLVVGGCNSAGVTLSAVLEYDPANGSWKELRNLLTARYGCVVTVLGGDVVVMGGYGPSDECLESVERYNRRSKCWEAMPSLIDPLPTLAATVVRV